MAVPPRRDESLTAEVLLRRRRDEADALAALQAAQGALAARAQQAEVAHEAEQRARKRAQDEERAFSTLQGSLSAAVLHAFAQRLRQAQLLCERSARAVAQADHAVAACLDEIQAQRQIFLQRRALREAAELFAAQQRTAKRRARAAQTRALEEEARERFASSKRRGQT